MKKLSLPLFTLIIASSLCFGQSFSGPESVEYDPINNRYIVSNTTGSNLQSVVPGNLPVLFTSAVGSPYGLVVVDSTVYVCDNGDIAGYHLVTGTQTFTANVNGGFLNGLCADTSGHLYATDFSAKKIFKIRISDGSSWTYVAATTKTPNGILFDAANSRLVYCTWGSGVQIKAVSLVDSSQTILTTTTLSNDDGIAMDNQGRFYISVWGTQSIYMIDSAFANPPVQMITGLSNPADIYYNLANDTLAVPNSSNNTVNFYNMAYLLSAGSAILAEENFLKTSAANHHISITWTLSGTEPAILEIYTVKGALLRSEKVSSQGEYRIDEGDLSTGIYIARIISGPQNLSEKFFVE